MFEPQVPGVAGAPRTPVLQAGLYRSDPHPTFECTECGVKFVTSGSLKAHVTRNHSGDDRDFPCDKCPLKFYRITDLKVRLNCSYVKRR
jgi:hypothetical protein